MPWSSLNRDPVVINVNDMVVICRSDVRMDADLVDKIKRRLKLNKVQVILEKIIKKSSSQEQQKKRDTGWKDKLF